MSSPRTGRRELTPTDAPDQPPRIDPPVERVVADRYRLEQELGAGGWGEVHKAWDTKIRRHVALKLLHPHLSRDTKLQTRFQREAQAAGGLNSEHIITVFDTGNWEGSLYLTMPLLEGETLEDRLNRGDRLSPSEVARLALQVAKGLKVAHEAGVIHRDVKPSNIFLESPDEKVILLDFGVAKLATEDQKLTITGHPMGTYQFMSPEQSKAVPDLDGRSDLFSLGSVLYLSAVGVHPFHGEDLVDLLLAIRGTDPEPPCERNPSIPVALSALIMRLLAKDPADRPQSAGEVIDRIRAMSAGRRDPPGREILESFEWKGEQRMRRVRVVDLGGSEKLELVRIPRGNFLMGSPKSDKHAFYDEKLRHQVKLTEDFYIGKYQVTRGQFARFVAETGYKTDAESSRTGGWGFNEESGGFEPGPKYTWRNPGFEQTDAHPVVNLSWNDAKKFCLWAGHKAGLLVGLPTEAQWEYACRAGTRTRYFTGDDVESLEGFANIADATARTMFEDWVTAEFDCGFLTTSPVGHFWPNGFGLYDMLGNVQEWCEDWFNRGGYANGKRTDPVGAETGLYRVFRGGSYHHSPGTCRSAIRRGATPEYRFSDLGFRVAVP